MSDISYIQNSMFTHFLADTKEGENCLREMYEQHGSASVLNMEANRVIKQMRQAGYKVAKAKKPTMSAADILAELET